MRVHALVVSTFVGVFAAVVCVGGCVGDAPVVPQDGSAGDALAVDAKADSNQCSASELLCNGACVQQTASNCGACGVTCAPDSGTPVCAPTSGTGTTFACASGCTGSLVLCGSTCVNEQTDTNNCGGCGSPCKTGQACSGGKCVCDASSCPSGCCDGSGACVTGAPACGTGGTTCATGCPAALPEASSLAAWFVGDDYVPPGSGQNGSWMDRSGNHADASCTSGNCPGTGTVNSHKTAYFGGVHFFSMSDPNADLQSNQWSIFLVVKPNTLAPKYTPILSLAVSTTKYISFLRPLDNIGNLSQDIQFTIYPGSLTQDYFASLPSGAGWAGNWERVATTVDTAGNAIMGLYNTSLGVTGQQSGTIGPSTMNNFDYNHSAIGANTDTFGQPFFQGEIAEILVFRTALAPTSVTSVNTYLSTRYGF